jgi:hypothetical protein
MASGYGRQERHFAAPDLKEENEMITIPQNVMRAGMIAGFALGGIIVERLAILTYKLAAPTVRRLYGKVVTSSTPFTITPRRHKPRAAHKAANGHSGHHPKKGPKVVPPAAA